MRVFIVLALLLMIIPLSSSAHKLCSTKSYDNICASCDFVGGRVEDGCRSRQENMAKACLAGSYPVMAARYPLGMCPALDDCVFGLKACVSFNCPATDLEDCQNPSCRLCYLLADACAFRASADCMKDHECGDGICSDEGGENTETCCDDCGCEDDMICENNICADPPEESGEPDPKEDVSDDIGWVFFDFCFMFALAPISMIAAMAWRMVL